MFINRESINDIDLSNYKGIVALDFALNAGVAIHECNKETRVQTGFIFQKTYRKKIGSYKNGNDKYKVIQKVREPHWKLYNMLCSGFNDYLWVIEDLSNGMGGKKGSSSSLMNFGAIMALVKMNDIDYTLTVPSHWKSLVGLSKKVREFKAKGKLKDKNFKPSDKDVKSFSLEMAKEIFPSLENEIGEDDNKAEALLLLHWFYLSKKGNTKC